MAIFAIAFVVFLVFQASPVFADPDSFYHAKMALLIRDQGIVREFPWLQLTVLGQIYSDQHFLYHVLLIPFVTFFPPLVGLKLATVFFGASLITLCYWIMRQWRVRWAFLFAILLLFVRPFTFRISLAKAPSTSLILLLLGLHWIWQYRYRRLAGLAFTYVWYYGGFALLGVASTIYVAISATFNRLHRRIDVRHWLGKILSLTGRHSPAHRHPHPDATVWLVTITGLVLGIIINPYFPRNISFYYHQLINIGIINYRHVIGVGGEWYSYQFGDLVASSAVASLLVLVASLGIIFRWRAQSKQTWTLLVLTIFFFILTLKSRRYVEYFSPFAVLFAAFSISDSLRGGYARRIWEEIRLILSRGAWARWTAAILAVYLIFGLGYVMGRDFIKERQELHQGLAVTKYQAASQWLAGHSPAGSRVVHSDWDEFPLLFYHNSHNTYIVGLDPTFFYIANRDAYWTWVNITLGKYQEDVYRAVTTTLASQYVFVGANHQSMDQLFRNDPRFIRGYSDAEATIYQALPQTSP